MHAWLTRTLPPQTITINVVVIKKKLFFVATTAAKATSLLLTIDVEYSRDSFNKTLKGKKKTDTISLCQMNLNFFFFETTTTAISETAA